MALLIVHIISTHNYFKEQYNRRYISVCLLAIKTHYYIIFFVRPLHSKPGMELLLTKYRPIVMVGICYYIESGVTELLIMRDPHYGRMCFKSVKTPGALHSHL